MTAFAKANPPALPVVEATALRFSSKASDATHLLPTIERLALCRERPADALVAVHAAAVNPSDAKAAIGLMPYAVFPRTPGRDFSGVVIDGQAELIGKEVFGSSGDLG